MKLCQASVATSLLTFFIFIFWSLIIASVKGSSNAPYFTNDVAINCGNLGNSTAHDARQWFGDAGSRSIISVLQPRGKSTASIADHTSLSVDPVPYLTARISTAQFYYTFQVNPGQKFIRLHFYPSSYRGFERYQDFFTVEAGPFTLLRNFSASISADALGVTFLVKEFCLNVGEAEYLNLTFSPSQSTKKGNFYAFVNGIEIISMPTGLYYTPDGDLGVRVVGQNSRYVVDNSSALELLHRFNIGGSYISPVEDFGMFRRWSEDANFLLNSNLQSRNNFVQGIKYGGIPVFTVPLKIYYASWETGSKYESVGALHNFTWKVPVDLGFGYLVRLHFCDFNLEMAEGGLREFNVLMNNQIAETKDNLIRLTGGSGVPMYSDYVVIVKGDKKGVSDLLIILQSSDELVVGILHGLEIFKLSSFDNNLASPNSVPPRKVSTSRNLNIQKLLFPLGKIRASVKGIAILIMLNIIVFKLRQIGEGTYREEKDNLSSSTEQVFHRFSLAEIISATQNFSEELFIGRGGFGNVYKGFICGGTKIVAIKRLKSNSKQGAQEFWAEIETLSKIRHIHLVSLIGYCNEYEEMILVYEYMPRGTLADNLYKISKNGMDGSPLTWEQRLRICIGAARGLDYLHTGIEHGIIHRDVKESNILLSENLVAKISDFGLSKLERITESKCYVSTKVKGTFGYLDPYYLITQKLTRKSDTYSFGVVLLVVLCGKPAIDRSNPGETQILLSTFRQCNEKGGIEDIIDPNVRGNILPESLSEFLACIKSCLHNEPKKRPTMAQVVARLECSLERQQIIPCSIPDEAIPVGQPCEVEDMQPSRFDQYMAPPPKLEETVSVASPAQQEVKNEPIQNNIEVEKGGVFSSGEKDHASVQKPAWVWPWEALWNRGKPIKKNDMVSGNGHIFPHWHSHMDNFDEVYVMSYPNPSLEKNLPSVPQSSQSQVEILQSSYLKSFTFSELRTATRNFRPDNILGEGRCGTVFKGWMDEQSLTAAKPGTGIIVSMMRLNLQSYLGYSEFLAEISYLGQLHHPNLVKLIGYCLEDDDRILVYEYMPKGSLENHIFSRGRDQPILSWSHRIKIAIGAARGLAFLHGAEIKVIYREFRTSDILLDSDYNVKLSEFWLMKKQDESTCGYVPTMFFVCYEPMAPEYVMAGILTEKSNVYNFGVALLEIFAGRRVMDRNFPRSEQNLVEWARPQLANKRRAKRVFDIRLEGQYSLRQAFKLGNLALQCLSKEPKSRPTMDEVVTALDELQDLKPKTVGFVTTAEPEPEPAVQKKIN